MERDRLEKEINEWREFVLEEILKIVKKELSEDIDILLEGLKDNGIIKE
jgi:hypothetical protein